MKSPKQQSDFPCPGTMAKKLRAKSAPTGSGTVPVSSELSHWPVQLKLVSTRGPYFANADLLLVADCVPFAMGDFHDKFLKNHGIVVGCPKLDDSRFYIEKLAEILKLNELNSLTVIHMEVPCCSGLTHIAKEAIAGSGAKMSFADITISLNGSVMRRETIS